MSYRSRKLRFQESFINRRILRNVYFKNTCKIRIYTNEYLQDGDLLCMPTITMIPSRIPSIARRLSANRETCQLDPSMSTRFPARMKSMPYCKHAPHPRKEDYARDRPSIYGPRSRLFVVVFSKNQCYSIFNKQHLFSLRSSAAQHFSRCIHEKTRSSQTSKYPTRAHDLLDCQFGGRRLLSHFREGLNIQSNRR